MKMHIIIDVVVIVITTIGGSSSSAISKPGCPETCGNLSIPYPFGIGKKPCYYEEPFRITCKNNTSLWYGVTPVQHISTDSITISDNNSPYPYNKSSGKNIYGDEYVEGSRYENFIISSSKNKLVGIGCDIYAFVKDSTTGEVVSGCAAFCDNSSNNISFSSSPSNYCSGSNGCCQTYFRPLPTHFGAYIETMNTDKTSWASSNCSHSYFLIVEKGVSDFTQLLGQCKEDDYRSWVAMDWVIGNVSCDKATKSKKYACGNNSRCVDCAGGHRCSCAPGYQGNPYLGCQDIDECASPNGEHICPYSTHCVNTLGGFICEPKNEKRMLAVQLSLGIAAAISFIILVAISLWLRKRLRKRKEKEARQKFFKKNGGLILKHRISLGGVNTSFNVFLKEELEKATDNFNGSRILGKGGHGTVYKGMLSDGSIVAVKKSNAVDNDQIDQFINEILILSQINHRHIVKVLGCCLETEIPLLVYEYISNGMLSFHIHGRICHSSDPTLLESESKVQIPSHSAIMLSWDHRSQIAAEVAGALSYMHSCASTPILHRDIKSSNILLDDNFRAVVSDFGLSRILSIDQTHITTQVGGTIGYIDPEYFRSGQLTDKCDVYAFGVILAELLTSQRAVSSDRTEDNPGLVMRFILSMKQGCLFDIVDPEFLKDPEDEKSIIVVAKLASRCLNFNGRRRPCMKEVAAELDRLRKTRQGIADEECLELEDDASLKSESSYNCTSACTEEDKC